MQTYTIQKLIKKYENLNSEVIENIFFDNILKVLVPYANKTFIYEINRLKNNEMLLGDSNDDRYEFFMDNYLSDEESILNFLKEYPVLARILSTRFYDCVDNLIVAIERFIKDKNRVEELFKVNFKNLKNIEMLGDMHISGKSVLKFVFEDNIQLIYKPRNLSIDINYQKLLKWFNSQNIGCKFNTLKTLIFDDYGWQEVIDFKKSKSEEEIRRFYKRQGQYLAILYMLNATDFHYENIIANGEHPYLIDLESLFSNDYLNLDLNKDATDLAVKKLYRSVIQTSLLPVLGNDLFYKYDVSGLGAREQFSIKAFKVKNLNTDKIKIEKENVVIDSQNHLPMIDNKVFYSEHYIEAISLGFRDAYNIIIKNREYLVSKESILNIFKNNEIRVIFKNTQAYSLLLQASTNPKYLKDANDRSNLFRYLENENSRLVSSEYNDLKNGYIPYFYTHIDSKNLISSIGEHNDYFLKNSFELVIEKLYDFSEEDCLIQEEFIKKSILANYHIFKEKENIKVDKYKEFVPINKKEIDISSIETNSFLEEAIKIADYIESKAIWGEDNNTINWISLSMDGYENLQFKVMDMGIYEGISGICLFYAYINKITGISKYKKIAKACLNTILSDSMVEKSNNISAFMGQGSTLYCLANLYILWEDEELLTYIKKYLDIIQNNIYSDEFFDFLSGNAGLACVCVEIYKKLGINKSLEISQKCIEHIINNSISINGGIGWSIGEKISSPLAGIAHGNAGILLAISKVYNVTKNSKYIEFIDKALLYENSLYDKVDNNWKDLRNESKQDLANPVFWCNGAAGIGMARVITWDNYKNEIVKNDYNNALKKVLDCGFMDISYSLCHGDFGNLELLLLLNERKSDENISKIIDRVAKSIILNVRENSYNWKSGIPGREETLSFMVGISGIGYQLLRIYNRNIPSILTLEVLNNKCL